MTKTIYNFHIRLVFMILVTSSLLISQNENSSPYSFSNNLDLKIAGLSASLLLGSVLMDYDPMSLDNISNLNSKNIPKYDSKAVDNWSLKSIAMSDVLLFSSLAIPGVLMANKKIRNDYRNFSLIWAESLFLTVGITNFTKVLVGRPRPYLYRDKAPRDYKLKKDNKKSFFSGHTSIAAVSWFLMASMYDDYNPNSKISPYLWTSAFLIPACTAYYRYDAGKHFPSDLLTGYIIGGTIGMLVPKWHRENSNVNVSLSLQPAGKIKTRLSYKF
ncbi:MAG: phosphatase PAP2 family protein [Candidatus Marinimicrobia bacterium]|nr:phosphatase PAP2 family protein [Candidatus Neomarinimicrobiota bacterium]